MVKPVLKAPSGKRTHKDWRYFIVLSVLMICVIAIAWRVVYLQVIQQHFLQSEGDKRSVRYGTVRAHRGMILDRNNEPLAVSTPVKSIWVDPSELIQDQAHWRVLAQALEWPYQQLVRVIKANKNKDFMYLKRRLTPRESTRVMALHIPSVYDLDEYRRYYPAGATMAHVIGLTDIDDQGQEGLELAYNSWLSGTNGRVRLVKDRRGRLIRSAQSVTQVQHGHNLSLSIDARLQASAYKTLKKAAEKYQARSASVVVLDARTSEILAMVNEPSYNPNNRRNLDIAATRNRAVTDVFEPGSVVKPLVIAAALASGTYQPHTKIDTTPGWMRLHSGYYIRDTHNHGVLDVASVLEKSSNIGVSKIAWDIGPEKIWEMYWNAGLGHSSGSGFPGERSGVLPNRTRWAPIQLANFAFGYGMEVTTLQLAEMVASIASGGLYRPATFMRSEINPGKRVMSEDIAYTLSQVMENVVAQGGTGVRAAIAGYSVAGKTGTAHRAGKKGYNNSDYVGSFVGFAPASDPRLVVVVVIRNPSTGAYYGGQVAAPVFAEVMTNALRIIGVVPDQPGKAVQTKVAVSHINKPSMMLSYEH